MSKRSTRKLPPIQSSVNRKKYRNQENISPNLIGNEEVNGLKSKVEVLQQRIQCFESEKAIWKAEQNSLKKELRLAKRQIEIQADKLRNAIEYKNVLNLIGGVDNVRKAINILSSAEHEIKKPGKELLKYMVIAIVRGRLVPNEFKFIAIATEVRSVMVKGNGMRYEQIWKRFWSAASLRFGRALLLFCRGPGAEGAVAESGLSRIRKKRQRVRSVKQQRKSIIQREQKTIIKKQRKEN